MGRAAAIGSIVASFAFLIACGYDISILATTKKSIDFDVTVKLIAIPIASTAAFVSIGYSVALMCVPDLSFACYWATWTSIIMVIAGSLAAYASISADAAGGGDIKETAKALLTFVVYPVSQLIYHSIISASLRNREASCCLP